MTRLADWMKREKVRPSSMAQQVGLAEGTVRKHMTGERFPEPSTVARYRSLTREEVGFDDFLAQRQEFQRPGERRTGS